MEVRGSLCARRVSAVRSHQVTSDWKRPFIFKQSFWEGEISPVGHFKQLNATAKFLLGFAPKETLEVTAAVARRPWAGPTSPVAGSRGVLESSPTHHSFCSLSLWMQKAGGYAAQIPPVASFPCQGSEVHKLC